MLEFQSCLLDDASKIGVLWPIWIFFLLSWRDNITQVLFVLLEKFRRMRFRLSYNSAFVPSLVKEDIFVSGIWWCNIVSTNNHLRENRPERSSVLIDADVLLQQLWCVPIIWELLLWQRYLNINKHWTQFIHSLWTHNWNLTNVLNIDLVMLQICTHHDSPAVMTCAKLLPELIIIFHVKAGCNFTRFGLWAHKPLVKWTRFCLGSANVTCRMLWDYTSSC